MSWEDTLRQRLDGCHPTRGHDGVPVSIKIRVTSGCYCSGCCPAAHQIIEQTLRQYGLGRPDAELVYERHENGPELLVLAKITLATGIVTLATSVVNLVATILKARSEGQKKGDRKHDPLELIVRGFDRNGQMFEEKVLRIEAGEEPASEIVKKVLEGGLKKHLSSPKTKPTAKARSSRSKKKA